MQGVQVRLKGSIIFFLQPTKNKTNSTLRRLIHTHNIWFDEYRITLLNKKTFPLFSRRGEVCLLNLHVILCQSQNLVQNGKRVRVCWCWLYPLHCVRMSVIFVQWKHLTSLWKAQSSRVSRFAHHLSSSQAFSLTHNKNQHHDCFLRKVGLFNEIILYKAT